MKVLNIYLVHSVHLQNRLKYINSTIAFIKQIVEEYGFTVNVNTFKEPTKDFVENNIDEYNKRVKYEVEEGPLADEQFNNSINTLNVCQISNIERHREIYNIVQNEKTSELHLVLEDDVLVGEDYMHNIKELFGKFKEDQLVDWDILLLSIASIQANELLNVVDSREQYKFLLNKSSYFINPKICKRLYDYLEIFKYNLKTGMSKFIWDNKDVRSYVLNKHTLLEGSKMGMFPSSVNTVNFLFQNMNFVSLAKITNHPEITDEMLKDALQSYKQLEKLNSPDAMHTMGVIYFKRKDYENAKKFMSEACENLLSQYGYISKSSEIINNAINIYQYEQCMLEACKKKTPKYM